MIYKAQGSNASWEWLKVISPCIALLRKLALQMNASLGARLGTKHHTPELDRDLQTLRDALHLHKVLRVAPGRILRAVKKPVVPNVMNVGLTQLFGPLNEYNKTFKQLQRRRREVPLADMAASDARAVRASRAFSSSRRSHSLRQVPANTEGRGDGQSVTADDDEEWYWQAFEDENYDPRTVFAVEEEPSLDINDYL